MVGRRGAACAIDRPRSEEHDPLYVAVRRAKRLADGGVVEVADGIDVKRYCTRGPEPRRGRDSMRVRSMPRAANSSSAASRLPGRLGRSTMTLVRSLPVRAGTRTDGRARQSRLLRRHCRRPLGQDRQAVGFRGDRGGDRRVGEAGGNVGCGRGVR